MMSFKKEKPTTAATEVGEHEGILTNFTSHIKRNFALRQVACNVCGFHPSNEFYDRFRVLRLRSLRSHCAD